MAPKIRGSFEARITSAAGWLAEAARAGDRDEETKARAALAQLAQEADHADGRKYSFTCKRDDGSKVELRASSYEAARHMADGYGYDSTTVTLEA